MRAAGGRDAPAVAGRGQRRRGVRPRPRADRPGVVVAVRLPGRAGLPRLPRRAPERPASLAGDRPARPAQAALPARRPPLRPVRRDAATFVGAVRDRLVGLRGRTPTARRRWRSWRGTPSCSATGGTRARSSSSRCCGRCRRPGCARRPWRRSAGQATALGRPAGRVVGRGQGPPAVGGPGGGRPGCGRARRRRPDAARRTPVRAARVGPPSRPGRPGPRGPARPRQRLGVHGLPGQRGRRTPGTGTPPTRPGSTPSPTPLEGRGPHPGRSLDGALASHLDARMLVAAGPRA